MMHYNGTHIGSNRETSYILPHEIIGPYVIGGFSSYLLALPFNGSNIEMWTIKPLETFNIIKHTLYLKRTHQVASLYKIKHFFFLILGL